jgi:hypothetical protein
MAQRGWIVDLGLIDYGKAWELQRQLWLRRVEGELPDLLLLLEHPHVITLGRRGNRSFLIASPEELEKRVWGSRTAIQVEKMNNRILAAVKKLKPKSLSVEENRIILTLADPQRENPDFVQAVISAGGRIQYVTELTAGLEETYLKVIEETK